MEKEVNNLEELKNIVEKEPAVVVYFFNDHCAPCISLRPKIREMISEEFPKMHLLFVNSEPHPEITSQYNVFSYPTLVIFFDGREFRRESKYVSLAQLSENIMRPYKLLLGEES